VPTACYLGEILRARWRRGSQGLRESTYNNPLPLPTEGVRTEDFNPPRASVRVRSANVGVLFYLSAFFKKERILHLAETLQVTLPPGCTVSRLRGQQKIFTAVETSHMVISLVVISLSESVRFLNTIITISSSIYRLFKISFPVWRFYIIAIILKIILSATFRNLFCFTHTRVCKEILPNTLSRFTVSLRPSICKICIWISM
jgi:hypothetical protein